MTSMQSVYEHDPERKGHNEKRHLSHLFMPNGSILAIGDWRFSNVMAAEVVRAWDEARNG